MVIEAASLILLESLSGDEQLAKGLKILGSTGLVSADFHLCLVERQTQLNKRTNAVHCSASQQPSCALERLAGWNIPLGADGVEQESYC